MNGCAFGTLTYNYAILLQNGRECADKLFCKLSWMQYAKPVIDGYIPVGTLISDTGQNACGLTNSIVMFAPIDPNLPTFFTVFNLFYNSNPIVIGGSFTSITELMDAVVAELTTASGTQWNYTQISDYEFLLCTAYTQNGDTVEIDIVVTQEFQLGNITMNVTLSGGEAPDTPEYQTEAMNCITLAQYNDMVQTYENFTDNISCCDIPKPTVTEDCVVDDGNENIELRESLDNELREDGN